MRRGPLIAVAAFLATLMLPNIAAAQSVAFATGGGFSNMRAGPGTNFPVVLQVPPGTRVNVFGCLATRDWCDSVVGQVRGWMHTSRLEFIYAGRRVLVPSYYSYFAPPVVVFNFGAWPRNYWPRRPYAPTYGKPWFGHPGGGGGGPVYRDDHRRLQNVPGTREDGSGGRRGGGCKPGNPNCIEGVR